jgi:putative membrane protein
MDTALSRTIRLSLVAAALTVSACGGDANKKGATTDTASAAGAASTDTSTATSVSPAEAVAFMAAADQSEVRAAQIAMRKATNPEVKRFAQEMNRDHSKAAHEDGELAKRLNVDLKSAAQQGEMAKNVESMAQQMSQQLNSTPKGAAFDKAYIDGQGQAHQTVLENLQRIAGTNGAATTPPPASAGAPGQETSKGAMTAQDAARAAIPHVQEHLDKARQIQAKLGP